LSADKHDSCIAHSESTAKATSEKKTKEIINKIKEGQKEISKAFSFRLLPLINDRSSNHRTNLSYATTSVLKQAIAANLEKSK